jgi:hypothetical protein
MWSFGREVQRQYGIGAIEKKFNLFLVVAAFLATAAAFVATAAVILICVERAHRSWTAAYGVEAIATVEGAINSHPGYWYALKLAWTDASGATQRVENVLVTKQFAAKIVALPDIDPEKGSPVEVTRRELPINYLTWVPHIPLVVEDAARSEMFGTAVWVATAAAPLLILLAVGLIRLTDAQIRRGMRRSPLGYMLRSLPREEHLPLSADRTKVRRLRAFIITLMVVAVLVQIPFAIWWFFARFGLP